MPQGGTKKKGSGFAPLLVAVLVIITIVAASLGALGGNVYLAVGVIAAAWFGGILIFNIVER